MMISLKKILKETMDAQPPAIIRSAENFSPKFIDYIKAVENAQKIGYKNGMWFWHKSPEGGLPTIGYGHKIKKGEESKFAKGVSNSEIDQVLRKDLATAKKQVYSDVKHMFNVQVPLTPLQEEILTDYAFNLGNIRGYPKFVKAVINEDWNTAKKHYIRSYTDVKGKTHALARNKVFYDTFLKDLK